MTLKKKVHQFQDLLSKLFAYEAVDSQFMINMVEDFDLSIGELPEGGCDYTDMETRDTWGRIAGQCRQILDAFIPKSSKDKDALMMLMMDSETINNMIEHEFNKLNE